MLEPAMTQVAWRNFQSTLQKLVCSYLVVDWSAYSFPKRGCDRQSLYSVAAQADKLLGQL